MLKLYECLLQWVSFALGKIKPHANIEEQITVFENQLHHYTSFTTITEFLNWYTTVICESNGVYNHNNIIVNDRFQSYRLQNESIILWCRVYLLQQRINFADVPIVTNEEYTKYIDNITSNVNRYKKCDCIKPKWIAKLLTREASTYPMEEFMLFTGTIYASLTYNYIETTYNNLTCPAYPSIDPHARRMKLALTHSGNITIHATKDLPLHLLHKTLISGNRGVFSTQNEPFMDLIKYEVKDTSRNAIMNVMKEEVARGIICDRINWTSKSNADGIIRIFIVLRELRLPCRLYINHELCQAQYDPNPYLWIASPRYILEGFYGYGYKRDLYQINPRHKEPLTTIILNYFSLLFEINPDLKRKELYTAIYEPKLLERKDNYYAITDQLLAEQPPPITEFDNLGLP